MEKSNKYIDERDELWSESRMDMFESFYKIPQDVDLSEYDLEKDLTFDNE